MTGGEQYTFRELIERYKIVVPKIQRDYVQGRKNATVEKNRKEFVEELVDAIKDDKAVSLNFVYGVIRGNDFIPIDGQQRLTTLFLLHLYALAKTEKKERIGLLKEKFSYQTRYTTNRFIEKLAENLPAVLKSLKEENDLCDVIRKAGWYASSWDNDPNVVSCLVMLRLIHETWEGKINADKPTEDWKITFMFLRLEEFGSDNHLYIRMNSRGKQLTDFENFKAELYEKVLSDDRDEQAVAIKEFKLKTDGDWYSMLWDAAVIKTEDRVEDRPEDIEEKARLIDALMKRIIHWTIVGKAAERAKSEGIEATKSKQSKRQQTRAEDEQRKRDRQELLYRYCQPSHELIDILRCDIDQYRALAGDDGALRETFCRDLSNLLNFLRRINDKGVLRFIANDILSISQGKKSIAFMIDSYAPRVLLYAVTRFANENADRQDKTDSFNAFYRVILNLVSTTEIDSPSDFQKAVAAISNWNGDTVKWLNETDFKGAFREAQVKEERIKCDLISNADWKNKILAAENTDFDQDYMPRDYFKGQIGFLLHMAGVGEDRTDNSQQGRLDDFAYYSKAVRCIFDYDNYWSDWESAEITNKPATVDEIEPKTDPSFDNLFHRAMLTKGLYMSDVAKGNGRKTLFVYNESHNNYDWRGAFRESVGTEEGSFDSQWNIAVTCLKKLLDDFKSECETDAFEFDSFRELLADKVKNFEEEALTMKDEKEKALCKLLIGKPCCFRYIRNNYYIYWDDATPEYLLMRLKLKRDGSFINITDELTKQGQTL